MDYLVYTTPHQHKNIKGEGGIKRGEAPLRNSLPSPLDKGRGIKGEGLINNLITLGGES